MLNYIVGFVSMGRGARRLLSNFWVKLITPLGSAIENGDSIQAHVFS